MLKLLVMVSAALICAGPALAASGDAWAEFAAEVEQACVAATNDLLRDAEAIVDPFGSESYGLAIVSGETSSGVSGSVICVFDKQTKAVEVGGELQVTVSSAAKL